MLMFFTMLKSKNIAAFYTYNILKSNSTPNASCTSKARGVL